MFCKSFILHYYSIIKSMLNDNLNLRHQGECTNIRSSHWRCSIKKLILKSSRYSHEKNLRWSLFHKSCFLIKKDLQRRCFPMNIMKFLRTCILKKIWEWLLLKHTEKGTEDGLGLFSQKSFV